MKKFTLITFCLFSVLSLYAKNIQEYVVTTNPPLSCQNCERKIKGNLKFESGVKKIETSIPEQRVTVTYDADKTSPEKLEDAFSKIGYNVTLIDCKQNNEETATEGCCQSEAKQCSGSCCK